MNEHHPNQIAMIDKCNIKFFNESGIGKILEHTINAIETRERTRERKTTIPSGPSNGLVNVFLSTYCVAVVIAVCLFVLTRITWVFAV